MGPPEIDTPLSKTFKRPVSPWPANADSSLDGAGIGTIWCIALKKRNRDKVKERLRGLEYRQHAREQQRAGRQKAYRIASMMREQGTLRGARKYLELKGIPFREAVDPATGRHELTVPHQITLSYDTEGRFISSRSPVLASAVESP